MNFNMITTRHTEIGYKPNVDIIEQALREHFGLDDGSHIIRAVAAHIWSDVSKQSGDERKWGQPEVVNAIVQCQMRLRKMLDQLTCTRSGCAISYPHFQH